MLYVQSSWKDLFSWKRVPNEKPKPAQKQDIKPSRLWGSFEVFVLRTWYHLIVFGLNFHVSFSICILSDSFVFKIFLPPNNQRLPLLSAQPEAANRGLGLIESLVFILCHLNSAKTGRNYKMFCIKLQIYPHNLQYCRNNQHNFDFTARIWFSLEFLWNLLL